MKKKKKKIFAVVVQIDGCCRSYFGLNEFDLDFVKMLCSDLHLTYDVYSFEKTYFNFTK